MGMGICVMTACGGSDTAGPARIPDALLRRVQLNHHAVTLAMVPGYDTIRLASTFSIVSNTSTAPVDSVVRIRYTKSVATFNDTSVTVDSTGLVTANGPTAGEPVYVVVQATINDVTVTDSAAFFVTTGLDSSVLDTFRLQLERPDGTVLPGSSTTDCGGFFVRIRPINLRVVARSAQGQALNNVLVAFTASSSTRLPIGTSGSYDRLVSNTMLVQPPAPLCVDNVAGPVWVTATTTLYGVTRTDSVRIVVTPPMAVSLTVLQRTPAATGAPVSYASPATVTILAGGYVAWVSQRIADNENTHNPPPQPFDVVFDDPSNVEVIDTALFNGLVPAGPPEPNGNIGEFLPPPGDFVLEYRTRRFPVPGTYHYHSVIHGTTGTIIVVPPDPSAQNSF